MIYKEIAAVVPPYFTGLSVFAGLGVFGLSGVVYGPVRRWQGCLSLWDCVFVGWYVV